MLITKLKCLRGKQETKMDEKQEPGVNDPKVVLAEKLVELGVNHTDASIIALDADAGIDRAYIESFKLGDSRTEKVCLLLHRYPGVIFYGRFLGNPNFGWDGKWAVAIATRIADESSFSENDDVYQLLVKVLTNVFTHCPDQAQLLVGTPIIEEGYFEDIETLQNGKD